MAPLSTLNRLRPRERDRLALGAPAGKRRQSAQNEAGVRDRLSADLVKCARHCAGPMRRQQQALDLSRRLVGRRGLLRKDIGRSAETTALDLPQKLGEN